LYRAHEPWWWWRTPVSDPGAGVAIVCVRAHVVTSSERWPAALCLPRFSPNSCPINQHAIIFSHFKNIKRFKKLTFHGGIYYFIPKKKSKSKFPSNKKCLKYFENILFS
jgi:hypothetical protein